MIAWYKKRIHQHCVNRVTWKCFFNQQRSMLAIHYTKFSRAPIIKQIWLQKQTNFSSMYTSSEHPPKETAKTRCANNSNSKFHTYPSTLFISISVLDTCREQKQLFHQSLQHGDELHKDVWTFQHHTNTGLSGYTRTHISLLYSLHHILSSS